MSTGEVRKYLLKSIVFGDRNVGKTALIKRILDNQFIEAYKPTRLVDFLTKELQEFSIAENKKCRATIHIWDVIPEISQETCGFIRGVDFAIIMYDVTNEESCKNIHYWRTFLSEFVDIEKLPIMIVGNKTDLNMTQPPSFSLSSCDITIMSGNMHHYQISVKDNVNVNEMFVFATQQSILYRGNSRIILPDRHNIEDIDVVVRSSGCGC